MKQHFLPRVYQAGFTDPKVPTKHTPHVWILSREDGTWKKRAPKKLAWLTDLHTLHLPDGTRDDSVETQLCAIETRFGAAMRHDFWGGPLRPQPRADIASFISALLVRSPRFFREFVPQILASRSALQLFSVKVPRFAEALRKNFEGPEIENVPVWFSSLSPDAQKAVVFAVVLPVIPADAKKLYERSWVYAITTQTNPFITSDTPVCFIRADGKERPAGVREYDDPQTTIAVPLSATVALVSPHGNKQATVRATDELVAELNQRVLWQSREFLLSCQTTFSGDTELAAWLGRRPLPDIRRVTNSLVGLPDVK